MKYEIPLSCFVRCSNVALPRSFRAVRRAQVRRQTRTVRGAKVVRHHEDVRGGVGRLRESPGNARDEGGQAAPRLATRDFQETRSCTNFRKQTRRWMRPSMTIRSRCY